METFLTTEITGVTDDKFKTGVPFKAIAYHGTKDIIQEFVINVDTVGSFTCNNGGAVFFTSDLQVAMEYSAECQMREWENQTENLNKPMEEYYQAVAKAHFNAHCYEVELNICNPLVLDIASINRGKNFARHGIDNTLDAHTLNHLVNILQGRRYQECMEFYDEDTNYNTIDNFDYLFKRYNEELDDYEEIPYDYDCIIIENCIDSINEDSNYMPSTIYAVLDPGIVKIKKCIKA